MLIDVIARELDSHWVPITPRHMKLKLSLVNHRYASSITFNGYELGELFIVRELYSHWVTHPPMSGTKLSLVNDMYNV